MTTVTKYAVSDLLDMLHNNSGALNTLLSAAGEVGGIQIIGQLRVLNARIEHNNNTLTGDDLERANAVLLETEIEIPNIYA